MTAPRWLAVSAEAAGSRPVGAAATATGASATARAIDEGLLGGAAFDMRLKDAAPVCMARWNADHERNRAGREHTSQEKLEPSWLRKLII